MSEGISPILMAAKLQRLRTEADVRRNTEMIYESSRRRKAVEAHKKSAHNLLSSARILRRTALDLAWLIGDAQNKSDAETLALFFETYERNCKTSEATYDKSPVEEFINDDPNQSIDPVRVDKEAAAEYLQKCRQQKAQSAPQKSVGNEAMSKSDDISPPTTATARQTP